MFIKTPNDIRIGTAIDDYPLYDALWHLEAIGLLDDTRAAILASKQQKRPVRVAIIDTSIATEHPCLLDAIDNERSVDFGSTRLGALPFVDAKTDDPAKRKLKSKVLVPVMPDYSAMPEVAALAAELSARLQPGQFALQGVLPAINPVFSNHGTAIAGLVGARPVTVQRRVPKSIDDSRMDLVPQPLPYMGGHPHASIIGISTSFDPDPEQMILALLHAELCGADIILLARDIADPSRSVPVRAELADAIAQVLPSKSDRALWDALHAFMLVLSTRIPIICAAGNGNETGCVYPANCAAKDNGIISVGAINAMGHLAAYSATGALLHAPSSDGERHDRQDIRRDPRAPEMLQPSLPPNASRFSHLNIIATDVPGRGGYSGSRYQSSNLPKDVVREIGSYFCTFGGTSAASAITAGFLAAAIGAGECPWPDAGRGLAAREWLLANVAASPVDSSLQVIALKKQLRLPGERYRMAMAV
jgi:subtilisin family serine protease